MPLPTRLLDLETSTETLPSTGLEAVEELSAELSREIAEAVLKNIGLPELCRIYVELVRQIPEVQRVYLRAEDNSGCILTLIDAPPFERQVRNRVYEAQQAVLERVISGPIEFRLINVREVHDDLSQIVPSDSTILYPKK